MRSLAGTSRRRGDQIRFVEEIIEQLTANGVMDGRRLHEAPFTDFAYAGPDVLFDDATVTRIFDVLREVRDHAVVTRTSA